MIRSCFLMTAATMAFLTTICCSQTTSQSNIYTIYHERNRQSDHSAESKSSKTTTDQIFFHCHCLRHCHWQQDLWNSRLQKVTDQSESAQSYQPHPRHRREDFLTVLMDISITANLILNLRHQMPPHIRIYYRIHIPLPRCQHLVALRSGQHHSSYVWS